MFNKGDVKDGTQCTIALHVDDLMITCKNKTIIDMVVADIIGVYKDVAVRRGTVHPYLGMTFDFAKEGKVQVSMDGYVTDLLEHFEVRGKAKTPATADLFTVNDEAMKLGQVDKEAFHSKTAKLLYLGKRVRPDILTAIVFLATRVQGPDTDDAKKLERVLMYLNGTREMCLTLEAMDPVQVIAYIDASYGVHVNGKSHTGSVITFGKGAIHARSAKQKLVSKSSTEFELVALSDEASPVLWMRNFLLHQGYQPQPAKIFQDNKSTITMAEKGRSTSDKTRHINIRYFFVKHYMDSDELKIEYLPTEEMVADVLTKPLQGDLFRRMRNKLLNVDDA